MVGVEGALVVDKMGGEYASYTKWTQGKLVENATKTFSKGA
jgi:hypothetical protein